MVKYYSLLINPQEGERVQELYRWLMEHLLIGQWKQMSTTTESINIEVSTTDEDKFLAYIEIPDDKRERLDPGSIINGYTQIYRGWTKKTVEKPKKKARKKSFLELLFSFFTKLFNPQTKKDSS